MEPKCERTQYGHSRTTCGCKECSIWCRFMPGYMVPDDVRRMYDATKLDGESVEDWARRTLLASPGATVGVVVQDPQVPTQKALQVIQIGTLVPARKADGSCIHLAADGKCSIHAVSPFGCAFIDSHMSKVQADAISTKGLNDLLTHLRDPLSPYYAIWNLLKAEGKVSPSPKESRRKVADAIKEPE